MVATATQVSTREDKLERSRKIIRTYMNQVGGVQISLRKFTNMLNEFVILKGIDGFTHQALHNWLHKNHLPDKKMLQIIKYATHENSWQHQFAWDLLKVQEDA